MIKEEDLKGQKNFYITPNNLEKKGKRLGLPCTRGVNRKGIDREVWDEIKVVLRL